MSILLKRIIICAIISIISVFTLFACNSNKAQTEEPDNTPVVNYQETNNYEIKTDSYLINPDSPENEQFGLQVIHPVDVKATYGFIFFVGTAIGPSFYEYLSTTLAKQGYIVAIPDVTLAMTYLNYEDETRPAVNKIYELYPNVKFFVGGHSQGGGTAMRYAYENPQKPAGAIFMSPLCYDHDIEVDGDIVTISETMSNSTLPTLLLEADRDHVLEDSMKADALSRMPQTYTHYMLSPACHMSFSTGDSDDILSFFNGDGDGITQAEKNKQREDTLSYVLAFLKANTH